jgi:hypothetical protein
MCTFHPSLPEFADVSNSEVAEQGFSVMNKYASATRNMGRWTRLIFFHEVDDIHNTRMETNMLRKGTLTSRVQFISSPTHDASTAAVKTFVAEHPNLAPAVDAYMAGQVRAEALAILRCATNKFD